MNIKSIILNLNQFSLSNMRRRYNRRLAINNLKKENIYDDIFNYFKKSSSTGISWSDCWELYNYVRQNKPKNILECGQGASTFAMALALKKNETEGFPGKITAMEELKKYYDIGVDLMPKELKKYVEFVLSPRVDDYHEIFRGVRYRDIPKKNFDFIFIDGPHHYSVSDNQFCFDFDFIHVLKNNSKPITGIIDYRLSTGYVLQKLLGHEKVKYSYTKELGFISACCKNDIKKLDLEEIKSNFERKFKNPFNQKINLYR